MSPTHHTKTNSQRRRIKLEGRERNGNATREQSPTTNFRVSCSQLFDVSSLPKKRSVCSLVEMISVCGAMKRIQRSLTRRVGRRSAAAAAHLWSRMFCGSAALQMDSEILLI